MVRLEKLKLDSDEVGTPHFKDVYVSNITVTHARKIFSGEGLPTSSLSNFNFSNLTISGDAQGTVNYADSWTFDKVKLESKDNVPLAVKNSTNMKLQTTTP